MNNSYQYDVYNQLDHSIFNNYQPSSIYNTIETQDNNNLDSLSFNQQSQNNQYCNQIKSQNSPLYSQKKEQMSYSSSYEDNNNQLDSQFRLDAPELINTSPKLLENISPSPSPNESNFSIEQDQPVLSIESTNFTYSIPQFNSNTIVTKPPCMETPFKLSNSPIPKLSSISNKAFNSSNSSLPVSPDSPITYNDVEKACSILENIGLSPAFTRSELKRFKTIGKFLSPIKEYKKPSTSINM